MTPPNPPQPGTPMVEQQVAACLCTDHDDGARIWGMPAHPWPASPPTIVHRCYGSTCGDRCVVDPTCPEGHCVFAPPAAPAAQPADETLREAIDDIRAALKEDDARQYMGRGKLAVAVDRILHRDAVRAAATPTKDMIDVCGACNQIRTGCHICDECGDRFHALAAATPTTPAGHVSDLDVIAAWADSCGFQQDIGITYNPRRRVWEASIGDNDVELPAPSLPATIARLRDALAAAQQENGGG